jgi:hypothetical protein
MARFSQPKLLLASLDADSSGRPSHPGVLFMVNPPAREDAVWFLSATHSSEKDLLVAGLAQNAGSSKLVSYRVGWILFPENRSSSPRVELGRATQLQDEAKPGAEFTLAAQGVDPGMAKGARMIVFFLAEANFSDGSEWKADSSKLLSKYD